jgi:hypothetical protein
MPLLLQSLRHNERDVKRHIKIHPDIVHETTDKYFCIVPGCKYAEEGNKQLFFSRKDHCKRHAKCA